MSDYELIQQRNISGRGVLKVPTDVRKNRAYILYASVFRQPRNPYANLNYNPQKGRYGALVFLRDGYAISASPIEYKKQVFDGVNDISGQTLLAVKCAYEGMLQSIYNLGIAIAGTPGGAGLTPINIINTIADYTNLRLAWDECRLVCYADTAMQLSLYALQYDVCNSDFNADIVPPVPAPIADIPPGTPIVGIDPPYNSDNNDNGNTVAYPGDAPDPCAGVGYWAISFLSETDGSGISYFKGRSTDVFSFVLEASPGCRNGQAQNLYCDGVKVYDRFACNDRVSLVSSVFSSSPPSSGTVNPNAKYPGC